jgi:hypothetical protein
VLAIAGTGYSLIGILLVYLREEFGERRFEVERRDDDRCSTQDPEVAIEPGFSSANSPCRTQVVIHRSTRERLFRLRLTLGRLRSLYAFPWGVPAIGGSAVLRSAGK